MERAVKSIVDLDNDENVEIIVVDDGSSRPLYRPKIMREWDKLIRHEKNMGGAVARNSGIEIASGEIIYLLDSDDYFIKRDFVEDYHGFEDDCIYYGDICLDGKILKYPSKIEKDDYIKYIFKDYPYIAQTSTLAFRKSLNVRFDIGLPKHQDWDLIFTALNNDIKLKKSDSLTYVDRRDIKSVSRTPGYHKSEAWNEKIFLDPRVSMEDKLMIVINTNGITDRFSFFYFYPQLLKLIFRGDLGLCKSIILIAKRYNFFKKIIINLKKKS